MRDLIDRQAAIDAFDGHFAIVGRSSAERFKMYIEAVINDIRKLPPAQPGQRWIPVTERLPENNDPVNVTWVNHNPEVYYADIKDKPFTATAHYHNGHWYWYSSVTQDYLNEYDVWTPDLVDKDVEIIAWMPLPEPWEGEAK